MGLNIKNDEVHRLARDVAARTGETMTHAIQTALEEKLQRLTLAQSAERRRRAQRVRAVLASLPAAPASATSRHDDLYDEAGLPQ
jgi:antitoxin VapB